MSPARRNRLLHAARTLRSRWRRALVGKRGAPRSQRPLAGWSFCLWLWLGSGLMTGAAQPPDPPPRVAAPIAGHPSDLNGGVSAGPTVVEEVTPDVVYLMDRQGQLVRVPRESYEAWERGRRSQAGLEPSEPPAYAITGLEVDGRVSDGRARLDVIVSIEVSRQRQMPLRIPLALGQGVLRDRPRYEGPGEVLLQYSGQEGLICWLTPQRAPLAEVPAFGFSDDSAPAPTDRPPQPPPAAHAANTESQTDSGDRLLHLLRLPMLAPVHDDGLWSSLQMQFPNCAWRVQLVVAGRPLTTEVNDPGFVVATENEGSGSRLSATGAKPELRLRWRPDTGQTPDPFLKSHATITITADHPRLVYATAVLQVTAIGGSIPPFRVQLPPGMQPILEATPGVRVESVRSVGEAEIVEVRPESTPGNQLRLTLKAVMKRDERRAGEPFEAAGFDVVGALLQTGEVRISGGDAWNLREVNSGNVTRRAVTNEARESGRIVAIYEFASRPCSLQLVAEARQSRLEVTPQYLLRVDASEITLDARLRCRSGMVNMAALAVELSGWNLLSVSPDSVVALEEVNLQRVQPLILPLRALDSLADSVEVRIRASQRLREGESMDVQLPTIRQPLTPQAAVVVSAPARISITADDPIELTIPNESLRGLTEDSFPQGPPDSARQDCWEFSETGGLAARFSILAKVRERRVMASHQAATLKLDGKQLHVTQRWSFRVDFGRLNEVQLDAPPEFINLLKNSPATADLRATLGDGPPLRWSVTQADDQPNASIAVQLGEGRREFELQAEYALPRSAFQTTSRDGQEESSVVRVPLLSPASSVSLLDEPLIQIDGGDDVRVEPAHEAWSVMEAGGPVGPLTLMSDEAASELTLKLTPLKPARPEALTLENSWLQTVLSHRQRWDRVAYRLVSNRPDVSVRLPLGAVAERAELRVLIDGQPVDSFEVSRDEQADGHALITVDWSEAAAENPHTLELWYRFGNRPPVGQLRLEPPLVLGSGESRRSYWQLVLPANEHLLRETDMTPEMDVRWRGWWLLARVPRMDQRQLEVWVGASAADPLPQGVNCYLFTDFGPIPNLRPRTVQRWVLVAVASGLALLLGLAMVYAPWLRRAPALLIAAVALGAVTAAFPESAVLAAQSACAGLFLVALSLLLRRILLRRPVTVEYHGPAPMQWDAAVGDSAGQNGSGSLGDRLTASQSAQMSTKT